MVGKRTGLNVSWGAASCAAAIGAIRICAATICVAAILVGCAGSRDAADSGADDRPDSENEAGFAARAAQVGTVQVYRTGNEETLPLAALGTGETITVAFDLVDADPRPLSVWFYHADREWRRDLDPAEYMESFYRDELFDYTPSRATQVPYVHYRYEFPNTGMRFRISGNYIVRVTEQGDEEAVLFERPFYLTEQATPVRFGMDQVMVAGASYPSLQPTIEFVPPEGVASNAYDFTVCFLRNGQSTSERCGARASLASLPTLQYYLEPEDSFGPQPSDYALDVSEIRTGPRIVSTDFTTAPFGVVLEPDYLRFPGSLDAEIRTGNPVIDAAVRSVLEPSLSAEYMDALFSLVPEDDTQLPGEVYVVGSFNDWHRDWTNRLEWNGAVGRYEGIVRLKQGRHSYRYAFSDEAVQRDVFARTPPNLDALVTAFVYYRDARYGTDRLISAVTTRSR